MPQMMDWESEKGKFIQDLLAKLRALAPLHQAGELDIFTNDAEIQRGEETEYYVIGFGLFVTTSEEVTVEILEQRLDELLRNLPDDVIVEQNTQPCFQLKGDKIWCDMKFGIPLA